METQDFPLAVAQPTAMKPVDPMASLRLSVTGFFAQPAVRKSLPALGAAGVGLLAIAAWWAFQSPAQTPLFPGMADADKAAVTQALQAAGIDTAIDGALGSVTVAETDLHQAKMLLAAQGLPKAAPAGDAMMAALPLGTSRAVEGATLRGAREADLARTIETIDAVRQARVHLAIAEPSAFVRDTLPPAASIMVTTQPGRTLTEAQVRAIRHLVASSVPGMTPGGVSIVDQAGALMSRSDDAANADLERQEQVEARYRQAVVGLLTPLLGRENFSAEVHADIDQSESQSTRETYPKEDRALRREEGNRSENTAGPDARGIPGAQSNQPPPAAQVSNTPPQAATPPAGVPTQQSAETYARSFDVGREISVTHRPEGRMSRVSVAVAIREGAGGKPIKPADLAKIEALVKGAVGFDAARGDSVTVSAQPFAATTSEEAAFWDHPLFVPLSRIIGGAIVALLVLLFIGRPLLRSLTAKSKAAEAAPIASNAGSFDAKPSVAAPNDVTFDMIASAPGYAARADLVRDYVKRDPERAAMVVRQMVQEDANGR
jgi:flagellar M-ring protein FliF